RQRSWDAAGAYYARAVSLDSTFALAHRRLAFVGQWGWGPAGESPLRHSLLAARFNHGLTPHDSLSIAVESLFTALTVSAVAPPQVLVVARRLQVMLDQIPVGPLRIRKAGGLGGRRGCNSGPFQEHTPARSAASFNR